VEVVISARAQRKYLEWIERFGRTMQQNAERAIREVKKFGDELATRVPPNGAIAAADCGEDVYWVNFPPMGQYLALIKFEKEKHFMLWWKYTKAVVLDINFSPGYRRRNDG
jgi:hypothetical protein